MPIPSKIVSHHSDEDGSHGSFHYRSGRAHSPYPAHLDPRSTLEDDPHSRHHSGSRSDYHNGSRVASSSPGDTYHYGPNSRSKTAANPRQRSYISISSDNIAPDNTELFLLQNENNRLKLDIAHLRGRVEALTETCNALLDDIGEKVTDTRNVIKDISTKFAGGTPGTIAISQSLNPKREDHKDIGFWKQSDWLALQNGSRPNLTESAIFSIYMEDGFGVPIPEGIRDDLRDSVHGFWHEMIANGEPPTAYTNTPYRTKEDFRVTMEGKYPWLRLCEGHWKVKQVWKNCYSIWSRTHLPDRTPVEKGKIDEKTRPAAADQDDLETRSYIEITSDESSPVGSKRRRINEPDARPLKKQKEKEVGKPDSHHARPRPKKRIPNVTDPFAGVTVDTNITAPRSTNASDNRDMPVASGSGTVHSSPPPYPPQATTLAPHAIGAIFDVPYTQTAPIPDISPARSTPDISPAPADIHPSQIVPATLDISPAPSTPEISTALTYIRPSQTTAAAPDIPSSGNSPGVSGGNSPDNGSNTAPSNSPSSAGPPTRKTKGKGRVPYKKYAREEWVQKGKAEAKFETYWRKLSDEDKKVKIEELMRTNK